jgi:hypothetical protein
MPFDPPAVSHAKLCCAPKSTPPNPSAASAPASLPVFSAISALLSIFLVMSDE